MSALKQRRLWRVLEVSSWNSEGTLISRWVSDVSCSEIHSWLMGGWHKISQKRKFCKTLYLILRGVMRNLIF